jgi:hypothetical protein
VAEDGLAVALKISLKRSARLTSRSVAPFHLITVINDKVIEMKLLAQNLASCALLNSSANARPKGEPLTGSRIKNAVSHPILPPSQADDA